MHEKVHLLGGTPAEVKVFGTRDFLGLVRLLTYEGKD
jgi:hypothetical protein